MILKAWSAKLEGLRAKLARERNKQKKAALKRASKLRNPRSPYPKTLLAGYLEKLKRLESLGHSGQNTMITKAKAPGKSVFFLAATGWMTV